LFPERFPVQPLPNGSFYFLFVSVKTVINMSVDFSISGIDIKLSTYGFCLNHIAIVYSVNGASEAALFIGLMRCMDRVLLTTDLRHLLL
jgi:hypothetical protein